MTFEELLAQIADIRQQAEPRTRDALAGFERQLKAFGVANDKELAARERQIAAQNAQLVEKDKLIAEQNAQLAENDKLIAELEKQQETRVTRATPTDIARSFRAVIDEFHAETREAEDVGVAIKTLDVEVKGLVEVDEQKTTLVLPSAGAAVDPTALSTLRVSFAAVPVVPAEAPPQAEAPPKPPPAPRARGRSRRA